MLVPILMFFWFVGPKLVEVLAFSVLAGVVVMMALVMATLVGGFVMVHRFARRRRTVAGPPPPPRWSDVKRRFDALRAEYAGYECDPLAVLRLPALADVTVPSTARFVDAFAAAQALDTDAEPPAAHAAEYATAVDTAGRAWRAARDAADRIRLGNLSPEERAGVQRVIKLLTMAERTGHDAERQAAYAKARDELARLDRTGSVRLPTPALAALTEASRPGLTAPPPRDPHEAPLPGRTTPVVH